MATSIDDASPSSESTTRAAAAAARPRKDVVADYLFLALQDGELSEEERKMSELLGGLPEDLASRPELERLAFTMQSDKTGLNALEGQLMVQLADLARANPSGDGVTVIQLLLGLVNDFAGYPNQPQGLTQAHVRALQWLMGLIRKGVTPKEFTQAVNLVRRLALEGAHLYEGLYTGLTEEDLEKLDGTPAPLASTSDRTARGTSRPSRQPAASPHRSWSSRSAHRTLR